MKQIARNRIVELVYFFYLFVFSGLSCAYAKTDISLPDFNEYNRGVLKGSEISHQVKYLGKPTDKLISGKTPPDINSWDNHSCVTTSLFKITRNAKMAFNFMMRSEGKQQDRSVLWANVRYYNQQGVLITSSNIRKFPVPEKWSKGEIDIAPSQPEITFAEVWLVKYQDAEPEGEADHAIYLADFKLLGVPGG